MTVLMEREVSLDTGQDSLGRGANILELSYLEQAKLGQVIDLTKVKVERTTLGTSVYKEISKKSFASFLKKLSVASGVNAAYRNFSTSVDSKYTGSWFESVDTQYAEITYLSSGNQFSFTRDLSILRQALTDDFQRALSDDAPEDLFKAYGTHVAIGVKTGGMLAYYSYSKRTELLSEEEFKLAARYKYEGFGALVGANGQLTEQQKQEAKRVDGSAHLFVAGGSTAARADVEAGDKDSYKAWAATIDDNPGFLGFSEDALVPVWDLASDQKRKDELELAFRRLAARQVQIRIFECAGEPGSRPEAEVTVPDDYKMLSGGAKDVSSGAGNLLIESRPTSDRSWLARGSDHYSPGPGTVTVYAIGIYDPGNDLWATKHFEATSQKNTKPVADTRLDGEFLKKGGKMVGGGFSISDVEGIGNLMTETRPTIDPRVWVAAARDQMQPSSARLTAYIMGLRSQVEGLDFDVNISSQTSSVGQYPAVDVTLPSGYVLVGGGAYAETDGPGTFLKALFPKDQISWTTEATDHIVVSNGKVTGYAIGLQVN